MSRRLRKEWREAEIQQPMNSLVGTYEVELLGLMRILLWWMEGDRKFITRLKGWPVGVNHLNGKHWGHFYLSLSDNGLRLNYNHHQNPWYQKPIRDTIRRRKDGSWIGKLRYLWIFGGWFRLRLVYGVQQ